MPHFNAHFALGCATAGLAAAAGWIEPLAFGCRFPFVPWAYALVPLLAVVVDFDYPLAAALGTNNHRLLFTHSAWPGVIVLAAGAATGWVPLLLGGAALLAHVLLDAVDWGTNLLGDGKIRGPQLLYDVPPGELEGTLAKLEKPRCYFTRRWYEDRRTQALELACLAAFVTAGVACGSPAAYFLLYFPPYAAFFAAHFAEYLQCRKNDTRGPRRGRVGD
ncbi:MAG: hypothetical protein Kow0069_30690 [Promethearchaeota archaeon]